MRCSGNFFYDESGCLTGISLKNVRINMSSIIMSEYSKKHPEIQIEGVFDGFMPIEAKFIYDKRERLVSQALIIKLYKHRYLQEGLGNRGNDPEFFKRIDTLFTDQVANLLSHGTFLETVDTKEERESLVSNMSQWPSWNSEFAQKVLNPAVRVERLVSWPDMYNRSDMIMIKEINHGIRILRIGAVSVDSLELKGGAIQTNSYYYEQMEGILGFQDKMLFIINKNSRGVLDMYWHAELVNLANDNRYIKYKIHQMEYQPPVGSSEGFVDMFIPILPDLPFMQKDAVWPKEITVERIPGYKVVKLGFY